MTWLIVYMDKNKGGLGIRNLLSFNRALFGKQSSRFTFKEQLFQKQVIRGKLEKEKKVSIHAKLKRGMKLEYRRLSSRIGNSSLVKLLLKWVME